MKSNQSKLLFNAVIFLLIGVLSIIRKEMFAAVISFSFSVIFISMILTLKNKEEQYKEDEYLV